MSAAFALGNLATYAAVGTDESALVAELKAGSEDAFALLIAQYHLSIHSLVARLLKDPSDAPDITQDVFIKVFRGIRSFHGESSLRTWIYRIAIHEASNQRRWWHRHRGREVTIEADSNAAEDGRTFCLKDMLVDGRESPFDRAAQEEVRSKVEQELHRLPEPFRTVVILRDLEGMTYDEIAEILGTQLGTVKSRLVRGRSLLRAQMKDYVERAKARPSAPQPSASRIQHETRREVAV